MATCNQVLCRRREDCSNKLIKHDWCSNAVIACSPECYAVILAMLTEIRCYRWSNARAI